MTGKNKFEIFAEVAKMLNKHFGVVPVFNGIAVVLRIILPVVFIL